ERTQNVAIVGATASQLVGGESQVGKSEAVDLFVQLGGGVQGTFAGDQGGGGGMAKTLTARGQHHQATPQEVEAGETKRDPKEAADRRRAKVYRGAALANNANPRLLFARRLAVVSNLEINVVA